MLVITRTPTRKGAHALGVKYVSVPNRGTRSPERRQLEKQRWFKRGQKWRTGCEGRISVVKRRHGLVRCRYHGADGMRRWVGLGIIADNLINMGRWLAQHRQSPLAPEVSFSGSAILHRKVASEDTKLLKGFDPFE